MTKTCRVLVTLYLEGQTYEPNCLVELADKQAKALEKEGQIDSSREAVLYCTNDLGVTVSRHEPAEPSSDSLELVDGKSPAALS